MDSLEHELRQELIEITNRLSSRGLIRAAGGNLSVRLNAEEILITPTRLAKGYLREEDIVVIDRQGHLLRGENTPSTDTAFHLAAYAARPDAEAVVHAHPLITTAFTVAGREIPTGILPEFEIFFPDGVPVIPYETPISRDRPGPSRHAQPGPQPDNGLAGDRTPGNLYGIAVLCGMSGGRPTLARGHRQPAAGPPPAGPE